MLARIEPAGWSPERATETRARTASLQGHLSALLATGSPHAAALQPLDRALSEFLPADDDASANSWIRFAHAVHAPYESLVRAVTPEAASGRTLRPTNYARNVFHMIGAVGVLQILSMLPDRTTTIAVALAVTIPAWLVEAGRRTFPPLNDWMMWLFGPVAHPHERFRANSASWYATAMTILALLAPVPASILGVAVLGFGDPIAAIVGRRLGRTPLMGGRTLEGSLGFVAAGWAAGVAALAVWAPGVEDPILVALFAAIFGAIAELFSHDLDDNLTIPLGAALGAVVVMWAGTLG